MLHAVADKTVLLNFVAIVLLLSYVSKLFNYLFYFSQ